MALFFTAMRSCFAQHSELEFTCVSIEEFVCSLKYKVDEGEEAENEWLCLAELSNQELQYNPQGAAPDAQPGPSSSLQASTRKTTVRSRASCVTTLPATP